MLYRLPLELDLTILELAAPPLAIDHLHDRVAFFNKIALVHRSFTAWAQDRLRDQFLYTYRRRPDEHARLKQRFEAGFGRDRSLRRLYVDMSDLPKDLYRHGETGTDSLSAVSYGYIGGLISLASVPGDAGGGGTRVQEQGREAVVYLVQSRPARYDHWELCSMITGYSQALDTLWIRLPYVELNIENLPRALESKPVSAVIWATEG